MFFCKKRGFKNNRDERGTINGKGTVFAGDIPTTMLTGVPI
jgi:hypothetical protein